MGSAERSARSTWLGYLVAVTITVVAVLSQYFLPQTLPVLRAVYDNLPGDLLVVYGVPIVAFSLLVGAGPLRGWRDHLALATWEGVGWYGLLGAFALLVVLALAIVYLNFDPGALAYLNRPNPALAQAAGDPWFFVGFSFAVGAIEETIFRGWIYGFWEDRAAGWVGPALGSSALFAAVHLYYGLTYGPVYPLIFPTLFLLGLAFAAAYHYSKGNLVVIAVLHGQVDAVAYLSLVNERGAVAIHYLFLLAALVVAVVAYARAGPGIPDLGPVGPILRYLGGARDGSGGVPPPAGP